MPVVKPSVPINPPKQAKKEFTYRVYGNYFYPKEQFPKNHALSFGKHIVGVKSYAAGFEFQFVFSDGTSTDILTETDDSKFVLAKIKKDNIIKTGKVWFVKKGFEEKGALVAIEFYDNEGEQILKAGYFDEKDKTLQHQNIWLDDNERIVGIRSNRPFHNKKAYHRDF